MLTGTGSAMGLRRLAIDRVSHCLSARNGLTSSDSAMLIVIGLSYICEATVMSKRCFRIYHIFKMPQNTMWYHDSATTGLNKNRMPPCSIKMHPIYSTSPMLDIVVYVDFHGTETRRNQTSTPPPSVYPHAASL